MEQKSLLIIKPDGVQRKLIGKIINRFENLGLKIHASKFQYLKKEDLKKHYSEHYQKDFYPSIEKFMTSSPCFLFVLGGDNAIDKIRQVIGSTEPNSALPGTIRGDFSHQAYPPKGNNDIPVMNLIHASATVEEAKKEIKIWFENIIIDYRVNC